MLTILFIGREGEAAGVTILDQDGTTYGLDSPKDCALTALLVGESDFFPLATREDDEERADFEARSIGEALATVGAVEADEADEPEAGADEPEAEGAEASI